jgi:hypothetical protein
MVQTAKKPPTTDQRIAPPRHLFLVCLPRCRFFVPTFFFLLFEMYIAAIVKMGAASTGATVTGTALTGAAPTGAVTGMETGAGPKGPDSAAGAFVATMLLSQVPFVYVKSTDATKRSCNGPKTIETDARSSSPQVEIVAAESLPTMLVQFAIMHSASIDAVHQEGIPYV